MASFSSLAMIPQHKYDVFLSFRGCDTRLNFVSHLHAALLRNQIQTYKDDKLHRGEDISPALHKAIQESKVSVIIFSENYAFSTWCLDELLQILQCKSITGQFVIPVFYHVDPSHVRKQKGNYAFAALETRFRGQMNKVQEWRDALTKVSNFSGLDSESIRDESKLVEAIVEDVLRKLNHIPRNDLKGLVGIGKRIEKIESLLCISLVDVRMVGVWGMGGIGKTTLATVVYDKLYSQFDGGYFLANITEESEKHGINHLGNKLLCGLLDESYFNIGNSYVESNFVKNQVRRKRVLIVLDDVNNSSQLEYLVGEQDRFGPGSRIIITTRDMQVLRKRAHGIYEVEQLNSSEALELFHLNSSRKNSCTADYIEMSNRVVAYANGVPLALKVLGSFFYSKGKEEWKSELNKLKLVPNIEIQNALKLSFEGLDDRDKEIFLDIACFFKGNDRDDVQSILNACGLFADIGIRVLIDKSLITIEGNRLWMHDLLQEMGKEIVRQQSIKEPGNRSRLWIAEDVYHLLKNNTGTAAVEGIFLDVHELHRDVHLSPAAFLKTYNLRLLKISNSSSIYNIYFPQGIRFLPDSLRYLHWDGYPLKSLPSSFIPRNLVELQMCYSEVKQLWCGVQNLGNLKKINLSYSKRLTQIPDLSWAPNLESLDLEHCESLRQLPPCFEYLEKLAFLSIRGCRKIKNLPEVPENIEYLNLGETGVLKFPSSVWSLNKLNTLILYNCKGLDNLPAKTCKLQSLEMLSLWGCKSLQKFPDASRNITYLCLAGTAIERVPSSIECLSCLIIFDMSGCKRLESLPTSICKLKYLESLYLSDCSNFKNFPEIMEPMEYLESVYLNGTAIEEIPSSIENLISLELLMLSRCKNLEFVPENICNIHRLHLHFSGCSKIENFPPLSVSGRCFLEGLYFNGCKRLVQVPDHISCLSSLQHLDLSESNIESLPASIKHLSQLCRLYLRKCEKLKFLPELPPFLQLLEAVDCNSLESVSSSRTELIQGWYQYFLCSEELNYCKCSKLDQDAISNIMADARLRILRMATKSSPIFGSPFKYDMYREASLSICYPGNQIPEWYSYQSMGSSINIKLPRGWHNSNFLGFALCAVVRGPLEGNFRHLNLKFQCESSFKTNYGESRKCACTLNKQRLLNKLVLGNSDHIFQWYSCSLYFDVIKEKVEANRSTSFYSFYDHVTEAEFKLYPTQYGRRVYHYHVKKCGIRLLYAQEAENIFTPQPKLRSQQEFVTRRSPVAVSFDKEEEDDKGNPKRIREEIIIMMLILWLLFLILIQS